MHKAVSEKGCHVIQELKTVSNKVSFNITQRQIEQYRQSLCFSVVERIVMLHRCRVFIFIQTILIVYILVFGVRELETDLYRLP